MFRYRVYTENKNVRVVKHFADQIADGYTVLDADGVWKKQHEKSLVIEFIGAKQLAVEIVKFARKIKAINLQEAVLVTSESIQGGLI